MSGTGDVREPERRLVSVVFADLTGFTAASGERDPEDVHAMLSPIMDGLEQIVERFGGRVVKTMGDGLMAVFGVPAASPEDPERAVRAAVAMRESVRERAGLISDLQAGVHTGWVFVTPARGGFDVIGDTVNVASRLVGLAQAGTVLVGETTAERTAGVITYRRREPAMVKGKPEPIRHYEVVDVAAGVVATAPGPFVARDEELKRLHQEWTAAIADGHARIISVLGPPGIGKSRLVREFLSTIDGDVLIGRAAPHAEHVPWFVLADALRGAGDPLSRLLAPTPGAPLRREDRSDVNSEIAAAVRRALTDAAARRPLALILEDVQWADPQLAAMMRDFDARPLPARILIVCLGRADTPATRPDAALGDAIRIETLARPATRDLIQRLLPGEAATADVEEELAARTGGNPLFVEEIVHLFRETGVLRIEAGRWRLDEPGAAALPESVQLVVAARIDALGSEERRLLRDAAVCGETCAIGDLVAMGWERADAIFAELQARDLIVADGARYSFRHAVIRDVAYGMIPRAERARRHRALADAIRRARPADAPVETLAHHYAEAVAAAAQTAGGAPADLTEEALAYLLLAGDRARSLRAFREAEAWYGRALALAEPSADTAGTPVGAAAVTALLSHARALIELHRYEPAATEASRALEIARAAGSAAWEAEAVLHLGWLESEYGNLERARRLLERAGERFASMGDTLGRARVLWATARTMRLTDLDGMLAMFEQAARLFADGGDIVSEHLLYEQLAYGCSARGGDDFQRWFTRSKDSPVLSGDARARAALARTTGFSLFYRGRWPNAAGPLAEARALARESGDFFVECDAAYVLARIAVARGALDEAETLARFLVEAGDDAAAHRQAEQGHVVLARVAARRGDPDAAADHLERAAALLAVAGNEREEQEVILARADIALDAGDWDEAARLAVRYRQRAERFGDRLEIPTAMLLEGRALLGAGRTGDAAAALHAAAADAAAVGHTRVAAIAGPLAREAETLAGTAPHDDRSPPGDPIHVLPDEAAVAAEAAAVIAAAAGRPSADLRAEAIRSWRSLGHTVWEHRAATIGSL